MTISKSELEAIAACCRNGAAMLRLADGGEPDAAKRERLANFNRGQAELLWQAAVLADEGAAQIDGAILDQKSASRVMRDVETLISSIANGRKIEAIKAYRTLTGYGLKEAKEAVETVTNQIAPPQIYTGAA